MSKGILTIIVIILAGAGIWYWALSGRLAKPVEPQISKPVEKKASEANLQEESPEAPTSTPETQAIPGAETPAQSTSKPNQSAESQTPLPSPEIPPSSPEPVPPPSPQPASQPPPPPPLPQPAIQKFSLEADDSGFYQNGQDITSLLVSSSLTVQIKFIVRTNNVYYGGLDFRGCGVQSGTVPPGGSTTIEFSTQSNCVIVSYWPASGVVKDSLQIVTQ